MAYTGICCWSVGLFQYCRPVPLLCSATLDQLLVLGATFYGSSNRCLRADVSYFLCCMRKRECRVQQRKQETSAHRQQQPQPQAIFEQNIGLEHILSMKKSTISQETSIYRNFLNVKRGLSSLVNIQQSFEQTQSLTSPSLAGLKGQ